MVHLPREGDQPLPVTNDHPVIQDLVMQDMAERKKVGITRYGTGLQPFNGRDMLRDAYEEALDLATYLRGCLYEQESENKEHIIRFNDDSWIIKHPLACRPDLFDCPVNNAASKQIIDAPGTNAEFVIKLNSLGDVLLEQ